MKIKNKKSTMKIFQPAWRIGAVILFLFSLLGIRSVGVDQIILQISPLDIPTPVLNAAFLVVFFLSGLLLIFNLYHSRQEIFSIFPYQEIGFWTFLSIPFLWLVLTKRIQLDFWLDEMISIVRHIQPSLRNSLFSYQAPNNHVFSNLVSGIYLQLLGRDSLFEILKNPEILRFLYLLSTLLTIVVVGLICFERKGKWNARIAVVLLSTTIPFLNFGLQVRGYSFSFLFAAVLLGLIARSKKTLNWPDLLWIVVTSLLIFFTIPSNIYFLSAVILGLVIKLFLSEKGKKINFSNLRNMDLLRHPYFQICLAISTGIFFGFLFYFPILQKIINNQYVATSGLFQGKVFNRAFADSLWVMVSKRWIVLIISGIGLVLYYFQPQKSGIKSDALSPDLLLMILFFPYLFSFIRGDAPFPRTFLVSLPVFILLTADGLQTVVLKMKVRFGAGDWIEPAFLILIFLICNANFLNAYFDNSTYVYSNLGADRREEIENVDQRIWASHFLEHYHLLPMVESIQTLDLDYPVLIDQENTVYEWVVEIYLKTFEIQGKNYMDPKEITADDFILISSFYSDSYQKLQQDFPEITCDSLTDEVSIYKGYRCKSGE